MNRPRLAPFLLCIVLSISISTTAHAELIDFNSFGNGEKISGFDLSSSVSVSSTGANLGPAIFDSDPAGPNGGGGDMDLLVDEGKVLILQNTDFPDDFSGTDFLEEPNDDANGGTIDFDFIGSVTLIAIDLVDIDASAAATLTLTDSSGLTRTYSVPDEWSGQVPTDTGFATLDLTTLADQSGPGSGGDATAVEDGGFDPDDVMSLVVEFTGSAALNNLLFVPEPTFGLLGLLVSLGFLGANRRKQRTLRMQT